MAFRRFIKRILAKILHERLMFEVKRLYYRHAIRSFWESDTEPIKHLVAPGDSVIDIGAHVGWYTFLLANLVGRCGRVYSVEPMPETYALLSSIVRSLQLENVETINCAVSDEDSYAVMEVPFDDSQRPNLYRARIVGQTGNDPPIGRHNVYCRSIDSLFFGKTGRVTFIKCDVEGHEGFVCKGARKFLAEQRPAWLIEVSGKSIDGDGGTKGVFGYLGDLGYFPYWFDGVKMRKRGCGEQAVNYFFLQDSHVRNLADAGIMDGDTERTMVASWEKESKVTESHMVRDGAREP